MKRVLLLGLLIFGLTTPVATPAQAIFGLSKCEKLKSQIKDEIKIGDELFKYYRSTVKKLGIKNPDETFGQQTAQYNESLNALKLTLDSDVKAWSLAEKSPSCFNVEKNSPIRTGLNTFVNTRSKISKLINRKNLYSQLDLTKIYTGRIKVSDVLY